MRRANTTLRRFGPVALLVLAAAIPVPARAAPDGDGRVTLRLWDYPRWPSVPAGVDRFHWIEGRIAAFEKAHPRVRVDVTRLSWEYGADKVRIAVLAGAGPDLIASVPMTEFIIRGLVEPVDEYVTEADRADYTPAALDAFTWNGHMWGWPWYQTGAVLLLNRDRFAAAGVPLPEDGRWSHEEFERALSRLAVESGGAPQYGLGFAVKSGLGIWPWLYGETPVVEPQGLVALNTPAMRAGLDRLGRYITGGWAPPGSGGLPANAAWEAFALRQSTAVAPFGIWAIPALRQRAEFPFSVAHYPDDAPTFVAVSGWMVLRHDGGARRDAAMALARYLTSADRQRDLGPYGVFPTRRGAGELYPGDAAMRRAAAVLAAGRPIPLHPQWPRIEDAVGTAVQQVLTGEGAAADILADATRRVNANAGAATPLAAAPARRVRGGAYGLLAALGLAAGSILIAGPGRRWRHAAFAAPAVAVVGGLMLWPLVWSVALSFGTYDVATGWFGRWVGLEHYARLMADNAFRAAVRHTVLYTAIVVPAQVLIALLLASGIAPLGARTRAWFRGAFYLPGVVSVIVLSVVWRWLFTEEGGALNGLLGFWGVGGVRWLSDPNVALWSIMLMTIARPPGGPMLIYLAALDAVPRPVYEAAALDGARGWRRWWHVTVPLVSPTTGFLLITGMIAAFQVFAQVYVLTDGGPGTATTVMVHQIYTTAMRDFAFGRASAMAVVLALLLVVGAFLQTRRRRTVVEY